MLNRYIRPEALTQHNEIWFAPSAEALSFPDDAWDRLINLEDKSFWFQHRSRCIIEAVRRTSPSSAIFDVGGGNGFVSKALCEAGFEAVLVEPGAPGALNAKRRGVNTVVCAPFDRRYFKERTIEAAALFDVIEHIEDDAAFLREVKELMRPNAHLFVTVPAYSWLWSQSDVGGGHYRRYNAQALRLLLASCGFESIFDSYFFSYLPIPSFLMRALPYRLGIRRKDTAEASSRQLAPGKQASAVLNWFGNRELTRFRKGKRIPFGGSLLIVARKADCKELEK